MKHGQREMLCFFLYIYIYLFIWLCWVLVAACGIFSCCMWDLIPWPGIEPRPPTLGARSLSHWTTREVPRDAILLALKMEGRATSWGIWATSRIWKRQGTRFSPRASRKELSPAITSVLVQWDLCWTFNLQNCKIINLCYFNPKNLW